MTRKQATGNRRKATDVETDGFGSGEPLKEEDKKNIVFKGIGVSPGVVTGKAYVFDRLDTQVSFYKVETERLVAKEERRLRKAVKAAEEDLRALKRRLGEREEVKHLYIIDVHLMILRDRSFIGQILQHIREMSVNAEWAVRMTIDKYREIFDKMEDDYLRDRFSDVRYVGQMILRNLAGKKQEAVFRPEEKVIVIAADLSPADTAQMMIDKVLGFATDMGSRTSHTAIVARSIEIPAVVGLENITRVVRTNNDIVIDGTSGVVIVNPDPEVLYRYEEKNRHYLDARAECMKYAPLPATTLDGFRVAIGGNIEFIEEIPSVLSYGAEGIGLYRTEFLYINRDQLPSEEEHFCNYRRVVGVDGLSWSTIRTFDLGGDKFFSDPKLAKEMNPQMGLRAIRFLPEGGGSVQGAAPGHPPRQRLRQGEGPVPHDFGIEEIRDAKAILAEVQADLKRKGLPWGGRGDRRHDRGAFGGGDGVGPGLGGGFLQHRDERFDPVRPGH
jgi:phosphotransferase system enzyme I (PtsI)